MSVSASEKQVPRDHRAERNAATRREILAAAWDLVHSQGLTALAMRDLGDRVGMRAQSLYAYFLSKHAIYDAMFREANQELLARLQLLPARKDPVRALKEHTKRYLRFCVEDPFRYQLLYQRTIPGFIPSDAAYAPAVVALGLAVDAVAACGITGSRKLDLWTAVTGGLASQQNSNEPGGERWVRLADEAIDMFLTYYRKAQP